MKIYNAILIGLLTFSPLLSVAHKKAKNDRSCSKFCAKHFVLTAFMVTPLFFMPHIQENVMRDMRDVSTQTNAYLCPEASPITREAMCRYRTMTSSQQDFLPEYARPIGECPDTGNYLIE